MLEKPFLVSRIKKDDITKKEKYLGYLIGPAGALLLNAGLEVVTSIVCAFLLLNLNIEKTIQKEQEEILSRKKKNH